MSQKNRQNQGEEEGRKQRVIKNQTKKRRKDNQILRKSEKCR
jgi:hypothetical protein